LVAVAAITVLLYRYVVSPTLKWCSLRLGSGEYPAQALNGTYPAQPARPAAIVQVLLLVGFISTIVILVAPPSEHVVVWVPRVALGIVLWKHLTLDYDAAQRLGWQRWDRVVVLVLGAAAMLYPAVYLAALVAVTGRLGAWTHHSKLSIRIVKATVAWSVAAGLYSRLVADIPPVTAAPSLFLILATMCLSHYVMAFYSKAALGDRPWDWVTKNRLDLLAAAAYAWGWRVVPERVARRMISVLARVTVYLNAVTLILEAAGLFAMLDRRLFLVAVAGAAAFNVIVALSSGILFLENIVTAGCLVAVATLLPDPVAELCFGLVPWAISVAVLAAAVAGWGWQPTGLGWWETPLIERVYWTATTSSGETVGIYNDVMSPFDREYARSLGNALSPEPFVTYPLGGVESAELRDRLLHLDLTGGDLDNVRREFGVSYWSSTKRQEHERYVATLFQCLGDGVPKSPIPRRLRWLKTPGGHLYYWGDFPRYRLEDGPLDTIQVRRRDVYFRSETREWVCLRDDLLFEIPVGAATRPAS
jgi:hypothetical protein